MAITKTTVRFYDVAGVRRRGVGTYTGPASYTTGGDSITPGDLGLGATEHVIFEVATDGTNFRLLMYDHTNQTVVWIVPSTGNQVAATTDLSAYNARFEAIGK
jgi:hypothetical protein